MTNIFLTGKHKLLLALIVLPAIIAVGYHTLPWQEAPAAFRAAASLQWYQWLLMMGLQGATLVLAGTQWALLLQDGEKPLPLLPVLTRYLAGGVVEAITPSSKLGGESARAVLFHRRFAISYGRIARAAATRLAFLYTALALVLLAGAPSVIRQFTPGIAAAAVVCAALVICIIFSIFVGGSRMKFPVPPGSVAAFLGGSSVALWVLYPLKLIILANMLGVPLTVPTALAAVYGGYLLGLIPLTPGGLGVYEAGMTGILIAGGVPRMDALLLAIVLRSITYWWPLILSLAAAAAVLMPRGVRIGQPQEKAS